ncbi:DUF1446-domain-containing protein [Patellaria atrata CBS 101060]|uniref:DUF1446-domain-containing protein n=1 Tax=Patellaria atrata CBS 101060 TaxID=1346257 RepID=A0A9P4SE03_9PEZI|nr:DUF1446-domain-containing protein [Patellaria atrata CBS 101060]
MSWQGAAKAEIAKKGDSGERVGLYDPSFMGSFVPALPNISKKGIKVAVNAGASDTEMLAKKIAETVASEGYDLKVAWIEGDDVLHIVNKLLKQGEKFENICFGGELKNWGFEPVAAQCYLGGAGIAEAFKHGADIVICGRVADAAPTVGAAMWWHGWDRHSDYDQVAGALMAGHLIECLKMTQEGKDQVLVTGVKGNPPPTTTKVGLTAKGGWQAEFHYYLCGLDIEQKAEWTKRQILKSMGENAKKFSVLNFTVNGYSQPDPENQDYATVDFRIFAQTKDQSLVAPKDNATPGLNRWCIENFLQSCPGATIENDIRQSSGKEFFEYWAALIPQSEIEHKVNFLWSNQTVSVPPSPSVKLYEPRQWSYETQNPVDLKSFGPTTRGPLGWVILCRSGDKASDANVGFFVRRDDEYEWLKSLLTIPKIKQLLGPEYNGKDVDRFEMPGIKAVHFLLHDHLDRSYNASSTYDGLGKNVGEYLRAKYVDIPNVFLRRGRV